MPAVPSSSTSAIASASGFTRVAHKGRSYARSHGRCAALPVGRHGCPVYVEGLAGPMYALCDGTHQAPVTFALPDMPALQARSSDNVRGHQDPRRPPQLLGGIGSGGQLCDLEFVRPRHVRDDGVHAQYGQFRMWSGR